MLLLTKSKGHKSNSPYSGFPNHLQTKSNLHISICQSQILCIKSRWETLYLRAGKNLIVVHQQFLPYFSVDSSVEKKQGYASHHQLIPPASNLVFLAFFCHTGYSMALFPSFWLFPLMNCMQFITAFLPYFSVDSSVEKNQGYERGHASHHQLITPAFYLVFLALFCHTGYSMALFPSF